MDDAVQVVVVACHLLVAGGYVGLGLFIAPRFDAAAPTWALRLFKGSGLVFFLTCAYSHAHFGVHIWDGVLQREVWATPHYVVHMVAQAVASVMALLLAFGFISLRVYDRSHYRGLLDRAIDEQAAKIAAGMKRLDIEHVVTETKRLADAAELVRRALENGRT